MSKSPWVHILIEYSIELELADKNSYEMCIFSRVSSPCCLGIVTCGKVSMHDSTVGAAIMLCSILWILLDVSRYCSG